MSVYPSVESADVFASHKPSATPLPELNPRLDHVIAEHRHQQASIEQLPHLAKSSFELLDDLQRICYSGCTLDDESIGSIQAKLIILRINLNVLFKVHTQAPLHQQSQA